MNAAIGLWGTDGLDDWMITKEKEEKERMEGGEGLFMC